MIVKKKKPKRFFYLIKLEFDRPRISGHKVIFCPNQELLDLN